MGLLGGSRIDSFTITVAVLLITYSILVAGVVATFTDTIFVDPYGSASADFNLGKDYDVSEVMNITINDFSYPNKFEDLTPARIVYWHDSFVYGETVLSCNSFGHNIWDGWYSYELEPYSGYSETEILELVDNQGIQAELPFGLGSDLETYVYCMPLCYKAVGADPVYIYESLAESIDAGNMTVIVASNATYNNYDIGQAMGVLTGFNTDYYPFEIGVLIGGIWWGLLILVVVKLVVG